MTKPFLLLIVMITVLGSCGSNDNKQPTATTDSSAAKPVADSAANILPYYKQIGDSIEIPPVDIELSLSARANEKLRNAKETIIVAAYFSGEPKDTTSTEYQESGQMSVVTHLEELHDERTVRIQHVRFARSKYDSLANKDIELLINVYSGRRSTDVNILDCGIIQDKMSVLQGKKFEIRGKLIGE